MPRKKAGAVRALRKEPVGRLQESPPRAAVGGRFTARRKREAVLKVLRGETLDAVSRSIGVTAGTLAGWHLFSTASAISSAARLQHRVNC